MLLPMIGIKRILILTIILLVSFQLAACGQVTPVSTPTVGIIPTLTPPIPTATLPLPTPALTSTPASSLPVSSAPDELRMAYIIDGNLYFQDGSKPPVQLTHSGEDRNPVFSDDGEKVIFYRGLVPHGLFAVNADGTQEKVLITGELLESLGLGYNKYTEIVSLAYVPGTHQVVFNTRQLSQADIDQKDFNRLGSKENFDLLSVDADTGEIIRLLPSDKGGNFFISPDGNMVAIQAKGHIDVIGVNGQIIRQNLVTYTPTRPYELDPGVFWTEDSTELVVTLPIEAEYNMDGPAMRSVWHYSVNGATKVQASLTPPPISDDYSISPDGNWILYSYYFYPGKTDETVTPGLYLGNLREGGTLLYSPDIVVPMWSTDNIHFVYDGLFLGAVDSLPTSIGDGGFLGWVDTNHYLYRVEGMFAMGAVGGEPRTFSVTVPGSAIGGGASSFTFIFVNR